MIKKSAKTYFKGFAAGVIVSIVLLRTYPSIYHIFTGALTKKLEIQRQIIPSLPLMLIVNNTIAALICAFGGYGFTKVYLKRGIEKERLYSFTLNIFPVIVLFSSGFVVGAFLPPFINDLTSYFALLLPHGIFELPATILSGSIGFDIADTAHQISRSIEIFAEKIEYKIKSKKNEYVTILILIALGGILEGVWPL
ncbi:MAG: stage II sporulation protein M [Candidatus Hydrothermarchaeales archaeon]